MSPRSVNPKSKPRPVTIVLGFTCKQGIVLACDSQISEPESTRKQTGVAKLARVQCADGAVLVAKAGSLWLANYFQEFFEAKAATARLDNPRVIAALAEQTMKEVKGRLIEAFLPEQPDSDAIQQRVRDYAYVVMLAYHCQGTPHIFTLSSYAGLAIRQTHSFSAAGCGDALAAYVLTGIETTTLSLRHALALASYTVEVCKLHDAGCGGAIQLGSISAKDGTCELLGGRETYPYVNTAMLVSSWAPTKLREQIQKTFDQFKFVYFNRDGSQKKK